MVSFASMCLNSTLLHPGEEKLARRTRIVRAPLSSIISGAVDGIPPVALAFTRRMTRFLHTNLTSARVADWTRLSFSQTISFGWKLLVMLQTAHSIICCRYNWRQGLAQVSPRSRNPPNHTSSYANCPFPCLQLAHISCCRSLLAARTARRYIGARHSLEVVLGQYSWRRREWQKIVSHCHSLLVLIEARLNPVQGRTQDAERWEQCIDVESNDHVGA
jgi:hypothetical protein